MAQPRDIYGAQGGRAYELSSLISPAPILPLSSEIGLLFSSSAPYAWGIFGSTVGFISAGMVEGSDSGDMMGRGDVSAITN